MAANPLSLPRFWIAARRARAWAGKAPRHRGEFTLGRSPGESKVFAVFGDSIGCGTGAPDFTRSFPGVVARRLARDGPVVCRVFAIPGARARTLWAQRVTGDERIAAVSIGSNDVFHAAPPGEVERHLASFLRRLKHAERVVVLGPCDVTAVLIVPDVLRTVLRRRMLACEAVIKAVVRRWPNARHVGPSSSRMKFGPEDFAPDGFHPNERGQRRLALAVYNRIAVTSRR